MHSSKLETVDGWGGTHPTNVSSRGNTEKNLSLHDSQNKANEWETLNQLTQQT